MNYSTDDRWNYSPDDRRNWSPDDHGNTSGDFDMDSGSNNLDIYLADDYDHSHNIGNLAGSYSAADSDDCAAKDDCLAMSKEQPKDFLKGIYIVVATHNVYLLIYVCFIYFRNISSDFDTTIQMPRHSSRKSKRNLTTSSDLDALI